jgi:hypothetical protein
MCAISSGRSGVISVDVFFESTFCAAPDNIFHGVDKLYSIPVGFAVPLIVSTAISKRRFPLILELEARKIVETVGVALTLGSAMIRG